MEPEQNTQAPENAFPPVAEGGNKNTLIVAGIAVVAIFALLGWYMLQSIETEAPVAPIVLAPETPPISEQTPAIAEDAAAAALSTQGTSDELPEIEADLNATDLNSLNDINKI